MLFLYLDAAGDDVSSIDPARLNAAGASIAAEARRAMENVSNIAAGAILQQLALSAGASPRPPADQRLADALDAIDRAPGDISRLAEAAAISGLSPSRFQHLFRAATGVTFRRYRLWRRMAAAARALEAGSNLTAAAIDAGFATPAHFSAAFRAMFGVQPSALLAAGVRFKTDRLKG
jgi:AraC-like DNA-binding protein